MQSLNTSHISGDPFAPCPAHVVELIHEAPQVVTLRLRFADPDIQDAFSFAPGQFNMLYVYGLGEVPLAIACDAGQGFFAHTVRLDGRVPEALAHLRPGDSVGVRGPFGRGWPLAAAHGQDVLIVSSGMGNTPVYSAINALLQRRAHYGRITIVHGVRHAQELIYRDAYARWANQDDTQVLLCAEQGPHDWHGRGGTVAEALVPIELDGSRTLALLCGTPAMLQTTIPLLLQRGLPASALWLSMERNMQCAVGHCGHCQYGGHLICRKGPVFCLSDLGDLFSIAGA